MHSPSTNISSVSSASSSTEKTFTFVRVPASASLQAGLVVPTLTALQMLKIALKLLVQFVPTTLSTKPHLECNPKFSMLPLLKAIAATLLLTAPKQVPTVLFQ